MTSAWRELPPSLANDWCGLLPLLGERASMLHTPTADDTASFSGTDFDCAVDELDQLWPLRLTGGWRLLERVHYDLLAWFWVLEREGTIFSLDTLVDPLGIGRDGFPTSLVADAVEFEAAPAVRGAYLTAKRIRKGMRDAGEWERIGDLARSDTAAYRRALSAVVGDRLSGHVAATALEHRPPDAALWRRARRHQLARRFRTPWRAIRAANIGTRRALDRLVNPTGLYVVVCGPDGVGKSSVADMVPVYCSELFRRHTSLHFRPGILPRPGAAAGRPAPDAADPHGRPPHGRALSIALLAYFWVDFVVGSLVRVAPTRARTGLAILQRGWWDIAVDPRRYRLDVPRWLVTATGRLVPRPDIALVLTADPGRLVSRKAELPHDELRRQLDMWRTLAPGKRATVSISSDQPLDDVMHVVRREITDLMEARAVSRLGGGWVDVPSRTSTRWYLPRRPRAAASASLGLYQPVTRTARAGWRAARLLSGLGAFATLPRGHAPPRGVRERLAPYIPAGATIAVARSRGSGRFVALVVGRTGTLHGFAKIATEPLDVATLEAEGDHIATLGPLLPTPLRAPRVVAREPGLLLLEPVPWRATPRPFEMRPAVAHALGRFFASARRSDGTGPVHGDVAPWNLLPDPGGWTLVDWEAAHDGMPFDDLCHFFVQSHVLLGRPARRDVVRGFTDLRGPVGDAVAAYTEGVAGERTAAPGQLRRYLEETTDHVDAQARGGKRAIERRRGLLAALT